MLISAVWNFCPPTGTTPQKFYYILYELPKNSKHPKFRLKISIFVCFFFIFFYENWISSKKNCVVLGVFSKKKTELKKITTVKKNFTSIYIFLYYNPQGKKSCMPMILNPSDSNLTLRLPIPRHPSRPCYQRYKRKTVRE